MRVKYLTLELVLVFECGHRWLHVMSSAYHHTVDHICDYLTVRQIFDSNNPFPGLFVIVVWLHFNHMTLEADIPLVTKPFSVKIKVFYLD